MYTSQAFQIKKKGWLIAYLGEYGQLLVLYERRSVRGKSALLQVRKHVEQVNTVKQGKTDKSDKQQI